MKKRIYVVASIIILILIIVGVMLSIQMTNKNIQTNEQIGKVEETQSVSTVQALETEPQVPETWDLTKVDPVLSEDNIYVPVPKGWTISTSEDERYVNGNVTKKGTLSSLTFTSTGDYPWTENSSNIWVSGNKQVPNSTSELISNEIEVGENGGWVQIEWSVCSQSGYDVLYMYINDTINGTTEQLPKEITGTPYGTSESSLIYTKCGKELPQGKYTISIKYSKYNNTTHTGLDSGYVKSGTYINYDENGADTLDIHKTGGFVIYEGTEAIDDLWTASIERNQFVWVPVNDTSRIYETNEITGKKKSKLWNFTTSGRTVRSNSDTDTKAEPGIFSRKYDSIKYFTEYNLQGNTKDVFYKELQTEFNNTIVSIEKYGGFYIGRYETGDIVKEIPVVRRLNWNYRYQGWYNMYRRTKNMSTNPNIQTNMIWGNLFDETLQWLIDTKAKTQEEIASDSTSWGNCSNSTFTYTANINGVANTKGIGSNVKVPTGSTERNKVNNIYDLAGNIEEYTIEEFGDNEMIEYRAVRGTSVAAVRQYYYPEYSQFASIFERIGCRVYFYFK